MKKLGDIDLRHACRAYAIANTPLFLLRKLRDDESIREISRAISGEEILNHIKKVLECEPKDLYEQVIPYALLVALSQKSDDKYLRMSLDIRAAPTWRWFDYIRGVLIETYSSTSESIIWLPGQGNPQTILPTSRIPVAQKQIIIPE
jgi:hypothetical protein